MKETSEELYMRYVFDPKFIHIPLPHKEIKKSDYDRGHDDGWNAAVEYYKAVGKI